MIYINNPYLHPGSLLQHIEALLLKDKKKKLTQSDLRETLLFQIQNFILTNILCQHRAKDIATMQQYRQLFFSGQIHEAQLLWQHRALYNVVAALLSLDTTVPAEQESLKYLIVQLKADHEQHQAQLDMTIQAYWDDCKRKYPLFHDCDTSSLSFALFKQLAPRFDVLSHVIEKNRASEQQPYLYAIQSLVLLTGPQPQSASAEEISSSLIQIARQLYELASIEGKKGHPYHDLFLVQLNLHDWERLSKAEHWRTLLEQESQKNQAVFQMIAEAKNLEELCQEKNVLLPTSMAEVKTLLGQLRYDRYDEDSSFADLCYKHKVPASTFNECLDYLAKGSWPRKSDDLLPQEHATAYQLNPETHQQEKEFLWVKLPVSDKRALILGEITDCCQSIGGDSTQCVEDGASLAHNGFYVLLQKKRNNRGPVIIDGQINEQGYKIIGQSYAWLSQFGNLCLDSVECLKDAIPDEMLRELIQEWSKDVLEHHQNIRFITVGKGGNTPKSWGRNMNSATIPEEMQEGKSYGDSKTQYIIAQRQPTDATDTLFSAIETASKNKKALEYLRAYLASDVRSEFDGLCRSQAFDWVPTQAVTVFLKVMTAQAAIPISQQNYEVLLDRQKFEEFILNQASLLRNDDLIKSALIFQTPAYKQEFIKKTNERMLLGIGSIRDFKEIMSALNSSQKNIFFEAIMVDRRLHSWVKNSFDFSEAIEGLTSIQKSQFCAAMIQDNKLRAWIGNSSDFIGVLQKIDPEQRIDFCKAMMADEKLMSLATCSYSFANIMKWLGAEQKSDFYKAMMRDSTLLSLIKNIHDLNRVSEQIAPEQKCQLYETMMAQGTLLSYVTSSYSFEEIIQTLKPENRSRFYEASMMNRQLLSWIKSADDFQNVIKYLDAAQRTQVYEALMVNRELLSWMRTADSFEKIVARLESQQKSEICAALISNGTLLLLIKHLNSFKKIIQHLSAEQKLYVCDAIIADAEHLSLIKNVNDFNEIIKHMTASQKARFYNATMIDEKLLSWVKNLDDFTEILVRLEDGQKCQFYDAIMADAKLLSWIEKVDDFIDIMSHLETKNKSEFCDAMITNGQLLSLINRQYLFIKVMRHLDREQKAQVYDAMILNGQIFSFVRCASTFKLIIGSLEPEQRAHLYKAMMVDGHLISWIEQVSDLEKIIFYLNAEQQSKLLEKMMVTGKLLSVIDTVFDFIRLSNCVPSNEYKKQLYRQIIEEEKLQSIFKKSIELNDASITQLFSVSASADEQSIALLLLQNGCLKDFLSGQDSLAKALHYIFGINQDYSHLTEVICRSGFVEPAGKLENACITLDLIIEVLQEITQGCSGRTHKISSEEVFLFGCLGEENVRQAIVLEKNPEVRQRFHGLMADLVARNRLSTIFAEKIPVASTTIEYEINHMPNRSLYLQYREEGRSPPQSANNKFNR